MASTTFQRQASSLSTSLGAGIYAALNSSNGPSFPFGFPVESNVIKSLALGVPMPPGKNFPTAGTQSFVQMFTANPEQGKITITNTGLEFDSWGRGTDRASSSILEKGLSHANEIMTRTVTDLLRKEGFR